MNSITRSRVLVFVFLWISSPVANLGLAEANQNQIKSAIEEIQNKEFSAAENIILGLNDYTKAIPEIVRTVYGGLEENADLILSFSKASTKVLLSLTLGTELRNEMKKHGHRNPFKLMALIKNLQSEVIDQNDSENSYKAKLVVNEIKNENEDSTKEILKSFMISNNFTNNMAVRNLCDAIFDLDEQSSDLMMFKLVNETISIIPSVQIADNIMYGFSKMPQIAAGLLQIFWILLDRKDMNNPAILRIANYISTLKSRDNYWQLSKRKKFGINSLIDYLPICARNLNFAKEVCIRNKATSEYIFASETQFYSQNRAVFTCDVEHITDNGAWRVVHIGNKLYFKNQAHYKEYLYASPYESYDNDRRHIQTWSGESRLPNSSAWTVELNGDYCYIKNDYFDEYLYATNKIHGDRNRYIFTVKPAIEKKEHAAFNWQIENCE